ncbi:MAG: amino acid adenylation domain-containing protein, partial [Candidatus Aminicenantes bacterium]
MKVKAGKRVKDFSLFRFNTADIKGNTVKPGNDFIEFKKEDIYQFITRRFEQQVNLYPGNIAIKTENRSITYLELDNISAQIAKTLSEVSPNSQQGVALLFETGIDMVVGMLSTLKSGNFYIPLDPTYPHRRLTYMLKDANTRFILTNTTNYPLALQLAKDTPKNLELINIGTLDKTFSPSQFPSLVKPGIHTHPGQPAYILYTSGSTGIPKGVVQTHRNVLHFIRAYTNNLHINSRDRLIMLCSYSFDAGVMDIYGALLNGAALYPFDLKQPDAFNRLPGWLREENITIFHSIPTVYRYLTRQLAGNKGFPDLRLVVMGGEAVYKMDVENFKRYFSNDCIFINGLGPTESTVTLQYFIDKNSEINKEAVPVGFPVEETEVLLIDKNKGEAPVYGSGEIVFKSDYLALGYLNQPGKTHQVFVKKTLTGKARMFGSGDMGKRLPDGNIEYVGRKDQQVKIRGYRIEPAEIEKLLDQVEGIEKSVVICQRQADDNGENHLDHLVAYYVKDKEKEIKKDHLIEILKDALPGYMVPSVFLSIDRLPLTPSGKIDRTALPGLDLSRLSRENYVAPGSETEQQLARIWSQVLGINRIGIHDNFFQLGGHSLNATVLVAKIHKELDVKIPLKVIFKVPVIRGLSEYIKGALREKYISVEPVEKKEYYALSSAQKRLYILQQMDVNSTGYNMPRVVLVEGETHKEELAEAFRKLIHRHESLRTAFLIINGEPVQGIRRINASAEFEIEYYDLHTTKVEVKVEEKEGTRGLAPLTQEPAARTPYPTAALISSFIRPFDLSHAPLMRVGLIKSSQNRHILMVDMHHIVSDGVSIGVLIREFVQLYEGNHLPVLKIQYKDFSNWQNKLFKSKEIRKQEAYWLDRLKGEVPVLNMPIDFERPDKRTFEGSTFGTTIPGETVEKLTILAKEKDMTQNIMLLAVYALLVAKYTGQEDIIVGSLAAGRRHADLENVIGMFANFLPIRMKVDRSCPFDEFLNSAQKTILDAYENQDYPFENIVENLTGPGDISRNPLFDTMLIFHNELEPNINLEIEGLKFSGYGFERNTSKLDFKLDIIPGSTGALNCRWEYNVNLLKEETIKTFAAHFHSLVDKINTNPKQKIRELELFSAEEKLRIAQKRENNTTVTRKS